MGRVTSNRIIIDGLIYVYDKNMRLLFYTDDRRVLDHVWTMAPNGYCRAQIDGRQWLLHRFLTDPPDGLVVDHINGNIKDNRLCNLQAITQRQNLEKARTFRTNTSGHKGVCRDGKRYRAYMYSGKGRFLGSFGTLQEAVEAREKAEKELGWLMVGQRAKGPKMSSQTC